MINKGRNPASLTILLTAGFLFFSVNSFAAGGKASPPPVEQIPRHENTNVILISLQCLRPDHLGVYGYKRDTSPNIDKLAKSSVLFENAISQANLTPIAQMSVFTSQYPRINGMVSFEVAKETVTARTLPQVLKYYGYTTAATVSSPEFFMRFDNGSGEVINPGDVFSRSFDYFGRTARGPEGASLRTAPVDAFNWIKNNSDKKFFLWIASGLLHMPYSASVPPPYNTKYDDPGYRPFWQQFSGAPETADSAPSYDTFSRVFHDDYYQDFKPVYRLNKADRQFVTDRYDAGVFYTDLFIGNLMKLLDSLKLTEKTLIVLQSMHGDDLGENGLYFHYDVTDTVIKNALFFRFPHGENGGKRIKQQITGLDVMPTVLDYLQIPPPNEAQGNSVIPLIKGKKGATGTPLVFIDRLPWWEYTLSRWYLDMQSANGRDFTALEKLKLTEYRQTLKENFTELGYPPGDIAVRTDDWKLIIRKNPQLLNKVSWWGFITGTPQSTSEFELYDLKNDPIERFNVADKHPEIVNRLKKPLLEWDASMERAKVQPAPLDRRMIIPYP
ncbi:MAG: sulfatase [Geobacteraceae bacterium]|nr:sulfatase [Geobacteraceae bacterium]